MTKKKKTEKKTKQQLITDLRGNKKELQEFRFRLSAETQQKTSARRTVRKSIARIATQLAGLKKEQAATGNTDGTRV